MLTLHDCGGIVVSHSLCRLKRKILCVTKSQALSDVPTHGLVSAERPQFFLDSRFMLFPLSLCSFSLSLLFAELPFAVIPPKAGAISCAAAASTSAIVKNTVCTSSVFTAYEHVFEGGEVDRRRDNSLPFEP